MRLRSHFLAVLFLFAACGEGALSTDPAEPDDLSPGSTSEQGPFVTDRVLDVVIEMEQESWEAILADPLAEEYQQANVIYDGERLEQVAVRVKGNSSLSSVAGNPNSDRFSFKLDRRIGPIRGLMLTLLR